MGFSVGALLCFAAAARVVELRRGLDLGAARGGIGSGSTFGVGQGQADDGPAELGDVRLVAADAPDADLAVPGASAPAAARGLA